MEKLIPADTVDAKGTVWETTGENIRHGAKSFSENDMKAIADILFPIGTIYCGENSFILSVGKWQRIAGEGAGKLVVMGNTVESGMFFPGTVVGSGEGTVVSLRFWKRVS